eukprot:TRINITY_DN6311_c0_g1_i4.p1 TRINITY_DN6311_c0_g1~~TRINITY_DN6311_c0_g1_i4.p1  ORF type:complete len:543 (+),score=117.83 TRINITY_DN6311_c0_g1_i4:141-1769(+)
MQQYPPQQYQQYQPQQQYQQQQQYTPPQQQYTPPPQQQYPPQQPPQQQQYPPQQQYVPPPQQGYPPAPGAYGGLPNGAPMPSMEDLARNASMGHTHTTVEDNDVKVLDPHGREVPGAQRITSFDQAPFDPQLKTQLMNAGFPSPSQIQSYTWPLAAHGYDVIGIAATGSGKTLAFLMPGFTQILQRGDRPRDPSLLVIAPTRELAIQIEQEAAKFGKGAGIVSACIYGGAPKRDQGNQLRSGVHCVIGTPGRIQDFVEGRELRLDRVATLVLDEADRMLDMGFEPQIRKILREVPRKRHTLFFTATWPESIRRLASEFLYNAYQVQIGNRDELKANQDIIQQVRIVDNYTKNNVLCQILKQAGCDGGWSGSEAKGLIFCTTKRMCDDLSRALSQLGVPSGAIHGDKDQYAREKVLNEFKDGKIQLLLATDVAARGLDIKKVTLVVNYDLPNNTEDYVHRIGRTGRAGQKGYAVSLVTEKEGFKLSGIIEVMKKTNQEITPEMERIAASAGSGGGRYRGGKGGGKGKDRGRDRSRSRGRDRRW